MLFAEEGKRGNKNGRSVQHVKYCIVLLSLGEPWTLLEIQDPAHLQHVLPVFSVILFLGVVISMLVMSSDS